MRRKVFFTTMLMSAVVALGSSALGQVSLSGLISSSTAQRFGLTRAWHTNVEVDRARGRIAHMSLHISSTKVHTVYEVVVGARIEKFSERTINAFGEAIGKEEAEKRAIERLNDLKKASQEAELVERVIPETTLYFTTDQGIVHAIDAETGLTRWARMIGHSNYPTLEPSASDKYVSVVNGTSLYVIDANDGKQLWHRQLVGVPGAGPAVTEYFVHVPSLNGMVETYELADGRKPPKFFKSIGRALIQPTVTSRSIAWPTDRGHLYVSGANNGGARYRLVALDTIVAPAAHLNNQLFVSSIDGYTYCLHEMNGDVLWRFSTGQAISHQPVAIGQSCYVITDDGALFSVNINTGQEQWSTPYVRKFLAASNDRIYCFDRSGRMIVLDMKTGARIASMDTQIFDFSLVNLQTDRIYIGMTSGVVQCLHETQLTRAIFHQGLGGSEESKPQDDQAAAGGADDSNKPKDAVSDDPFGGSSAGDPFGSSTKDAKDPFGSSDKNPFD